MFPTIVANNERLCTFVEQLSLPLNARQLRHVTNVADGLLVTEGRKTIAGIHRQFVGCPDVSNIADTFRIAPWQEDHILKPLTQFMIQDMIKDQRAKEQSPIVLVGLDDSLAIKDPGTRHLQGVDFHHDHAAKRRLRAKYQNALAYLLCTVMVGERTFTFAAEPYLREKTVRRLNRERQNRPRLHYKSKYRLARHILEELRALLPNDVRVYVLCDAWYASARLMKYCRRQGWHIICRVQSNRRLSGQQISQCALAQRHRRYAHVDITAADGTKITYCVRSMTGRLSDVPFDVCGLESRWHPRDKYPVYFISTDLTLSPQQALQYYAKRWNCEVDNYYMKQRLGLSDFRLQPYEAIKKYFAVVLLAWAYVQWRRAPRQHGQEHNAGAIIRQHRAEHAEQTLIVACQEAIATGSIDAVRKRFLRQTA
mgnify:FL=1